MQRTIPVPRKTGSACSTTPKWDKERHLDRGQACFDREQLPDLVEDGVQTEIELQREEIPKAVEALEDLKSNGADSIPADNG